MSYLEKARSYVAYEYQDTHIGPWKLTPAEAQALDALITFGDRKLAALALGIETSSLDTLSDRAARKIGGNDDKSSRLPKYIKWDRWRRAQFL